MIIIYEGTEEEYWNKLKGLIKEVIQENDSKKSAPMMLKDVCDQLGITYTTLNKIRKEMHLDSIYPSDIDRILLKYPKYIKKSVRG